MTYKIFIGQKTIAFANTFNAGHKLAVKISRDDPTSHVILEGPFYTFDFINGEEIEIKGLGK